MAIADILPARFIVGIIGMLILGGLIYVNRIDSMLGVTAIIGILAALGVYEGVKSKRGV